MLVLPGAGWLWLFGLLVLDALGYGVQRHHYESAGLAFGAGAFVYLIVQRRRQPIPLRPQSATSAVVFIVPALAAVAAFAWSLSLGPLSDDFVLHRWAVTGNWAPSEWTFMRPLPLGIWSAIAGVGGEWRALHLLNVVLHGLNSALVAAIAAALLNPRAGVIAGLVFALFPASTEAVAWTAGVFDLSATLCILLAVKIWLSGALTPRRVGTLVALLLAGLMSKESAIVLPGLLLLLSVFFPRPATEHRRMVMALATLVVAAATFVVARALASPAISDHLQSLPSGRREWKDLLVRPFSSLAIPVRTDAGIGIDALLCATVVLVLIGTILVRISQSRAADRDGCANDGHSALVFGIGWTLLSSLLLLTDFHVSPTLEGSRYLYLPCVGFALAISATVTRPRSRPIDIIAWAALLCLVCIYVARISDERSTWREAARTRDALLARAAEAARTQPCRALTVQDAPDNINGVYLFRVGIEEALATISTSTDPAARVCTFQWTGTGLRVVSATP